MSNFQQQSLDENAVILPLSESSPQFLHCEKERRAMESLMSAGPAAFYSAVDAERCSCFLSPREVRHITSWAQEDRRPQVGHQENGAEGRSEPGDCRSTYFPSLSDTPAPELELGWPEMRPWGQNDSITVHSSLPAEGEPHIREIIRCHLQNACQLIAIVTDSLTDGPIIVDLLNAASRGVPVYIILNQRSIGEMFTLNRLSHPNMRVRVLGGRTFHSRTGRTVVGEMKDKFLLVDFDTVIHGSYSLTWTDAHLHRQLVTVLRGPVVASFERHFRILFSDSLPVSDVQRAADAHIERPDPLEDFPELLIKEPVALEPQIPTPPSPPDSFVDWEAMGFFQLDSDTEQMPQLNDLLVDKNTPLTDDFPENIQQCYVMDIKREYGNAFSPTNHSLSSSTSSKDLNGFHSDPAHSPTDTTSPEAMKWLDKKLDRAISRQLSLERGAILDHRGDDRAAEKTQTLDRQRRESCRKDSITEEKGDVEESGVETRPSRKPLILKVPATDNFSSLSDIMRRIRGPTPGLFRTAPKSSVAEMSQSMMDLSALNTATNHHEKRGLLSRFRGKGPVTPASALMEQRNNEKKPVLPRTPKAFLSLARRHNISPFADRKPQTKKTGDDENT